MVGLKESFLAHHALLALVNTAVETASKGSRKIAIKAEALRLLNQNPNGRMSLEEIQGELARRAVQWGVAVEFD